MAYGAILFWVWLVGVTLSAFWHGWRHFYLEGGRDISPQDFLGLWLVSLLWPIFLPFYGLLMARTYHEGKAERLARRIKKEAEAKALHNKEIRSAHLRPQRRRLDLSE